MVIHDTSTRGMSCSVGICLLALLLTGVSQAAEDWTPFRLQGQAVISLVVNPQDIDNMFAIVGPERQTYVGDDLLKTVDGGATWYSILGDRERPKVIALDVSQPTNVYLAADKVVFATLTSGYFFRSTDGGETWDDGVTFHDPPVGIHQIVVHPRDTTTLYLVRSRFGTVLHRSRDGGESWSSLIGDLGEIRVEVDSREADVLYGAFCGIFPFSIAKSTDGGTSWIDLMPEAECSRVVAVSPSEPDIVYFVEAGDEERLFRSADAGATWQTLPTPSDSRFIRMRVHPLNPNRLYAIAYHPEARQLLVSGDGGENWELFMDGIEGKEVYDVIFNPERPARLFACASDGIYQVADVAADVSPDHGAMKTTQWGAIRAAHGWTPHNQAQ